MNSKNSYIELRTPSSGWKIINRYFDPKDNPDNLGYVRCKTCYERFPADMSYESRIDHLKLHNSRWDDFMEAIERSVRHDYNHSNVNYDDPRNKNDLKLSNGISIDGEKINFRFPSSRKGRTRYFTNRWRPTDKSWNKAVAEEYQNNQIGSFQGNFDKPIGDKDLRCGNTLISFSDYVNFRHETVSACKLFDVNRTKYRHLENKTKINSYFVTDSNQDVQISGPATLMESGTLVYTCTKGLCIFPCLCKHCVLGENECSEHKILHPGLFDYMTDYFTVRNSDSYNINVNEGKITFGNSMEKGYEMIYDVYKYAGIIRICFPCTDDVFHHQAFHFVYHDSCKFCRQSRHRFEGLITHQQFLDRFESRRTREVLSCHICCKIFSSVQHKNQHVQNVHEKNEEGQVPCELCSRTYKSETALSYHTQKEHGPKIDYNCTFCTKVFYLKHSLDVHVRSVHNDLTIACDLCKATFSRQSNLTSHYKYVHDQLENTFIMEDGREIEYFECGECSFETRHKKHLGRHVSTVHGTKKDFQCTECDYKCNRMDNLYRHIKTKHQEDSTTWHSCDKCAFKSKYASSLKRHIREVHA